MTVFRTLTGDLEAILGAIPYKAMAFIEYNVVAPDALVDLDNGKVYPPAPDRIPLDADGTFSIQVIDSGAVGTNVPAGTLRCTVTVHYTAAPGAAGNKLTWACRNFAVTADMDLSDAVATADPPATVLGQMADLLAQAEELVGVDTTDAAFAYNLNNGTLTPAALDDQTAALVAGPSDTHDALTAQIADRAVPRITGPIVHLIPVGGQSNAGQPPGTVPTTEATEPRLLTWSISGQSIGTLNPVASHLAAWVAREYLATLPVDHYVLVVPCGVGSTGFTEATAVVDGSSVTCSWDPANATATVNLYVRMKTNVLAAKAAAQALELGQAGDPTIVMEPLIWSQGENDRGSMTKGAYQTKVGDLLTAWRGHLADANYPMVVGSMTPEQLIDSPDTTGPIEMALQDVPRLNVRCAYVWGPKDQTAWNTNPDVDPTQRIHWSAQGQRRRARGWVDGIYRAKTNTLACEPVAPANLRARWVTGTVIEWEHDPAQSRVTSYTRQYRVNGGASKIVYGLGPLATRGRFEVLPTTTAPVLTVEVRARTTNEVGDSFWTDWVAVPVIPNAGSAGLAAPSFMWSSLGIGPFGSEITSWPDLVAAKTLAGSVGTSPTVAIGPDGEAVLRFDGVDDFLSATALGTQRVVAVVCKVRATGTDEGILSNTSEDLQVIRNTSNQTGIQFVGSGATAPAEPLTSWSVIVVSNDDANGRSLVNTTANNPASVGTPGFSDLNLGGYHTSAGFGEVDVRAVYCWAAPIQQTDMAKVVAAAKAVYTRQFA